MGLVFGICESAKMPLIWKKKFIYLIGLENTLEWLEGYDLSLEFTLHKTFIREAVNKKNLSEISEYDKKEYVEFILHEMFVKETVDKTHLLVMSENGIELTTEKYFARIFGLLRNI